MSVKNPAGVEINKQSLSKTSDEGTTWRIFLPGKPPTINQVYGRSWQTKARLADKVKTSAMMLWRSTLGPPPYQTSVPLYVTGSPVRAGRGRPQDAGACYPAVKSAVDALVAVGFIPDDGPEYVAGVLMLAPYQGNIEGLYVAVSVSSLVMKDNVCR